MKNKKIAAVLAALAMVTTVAAAMPFSANAAGSDYTAGLTAATDGTNPVSKNTTSFDKYLVMDVNANVPNAAFSYSISKYDASAAEKSVIVPAENGKLAVLNGVTTLSSGTLSGGQLSFDVGDTTVTEGASGADTAVVWKDNASGNEKYAKKTLTLDFSNVQFTEPGVYRYIITETGSNQAVTNDTGVTGTGNTKRTLDVYVEDYNDFYNKLADKTGYTAPSGKELFINGYVLYEGEHITAPSAADTTASGKSSSYTNSYETYDLTFGKTVTGNQGSKDKYFEFTVNIQDAVAGTKYDVSYQEDNDANTTDGNADKQINANPNSATTVIDSDSVTQPDYITAGSDGKISQKFYLQHGQKIVIRGLAKDTAYTVSENPEDYTATAKVNGTDVTLTNNATSGTIASAVTADFTNDRSGVIPTGVLSTVAGSAAIIVLGIAGVVVGIIYVKKKRTEEE